jgi:hypothetical protein
MVAIIQRNQVQVLGGSQVCRNQSISVLVLKIGVKLIHPTLIKLIRSIYSFEKPFGDFGSNFKVSLGNFIAPRVFITKVPSFTRGLFCHKLFIHIYLAILTLLMVSLAKFIT